MRLGPISAFALLCAAPPAAAQEPKPKPATQPADKSVGGVVTQPLSDINAKRKEIPPALSYALQDPYALTGLTQCKEVAGEIAQFDAVLGPDIDAPFEENGGRKMGNSALSVAGSVLTGFIPFRGVIREVSGANKADEKFRAAVIAGVARRSFLKGYGASKGCFTEGANGALAMAPGMENVALVAAAPVKARPAKRGYRKYRRARRARR